MKPFEPETKLKESVWTEKERSNYHLAFIETKTIFGIDIYKYSEYSDDSQVYVPVLFNSIYQLTVNLCIKKEEFFFDSYAQNEDGFKSNFISTGDGGFQIFDNPIQAIIFGAYFELNVRRFNSGSYVSKLNKNLFKIIDRIELRYCITTDKIFNYDKNFFGTGIINNARILAKDNLNRLLIDANTYRWFDHQLNTIENLTEIKKSDFLKLTLFKDHDTEKETGIFNDDYMNVPIKSVDILKIGYIKSKNTNLEIYNLKLQLMVSFNNSKIFEKEYRKFSYTIGNLNTQGIQ
jgi:hypothetical protein